MAEAFILLIEDNADHAELVRRTLQAHGIPHKLAHLHDGQEALDYLFREPPAVFALPDLVLLDLRLPRVDGLEVLRRVKESELSKIPVVILTTSAAERDVARAYEHHANSYLVKPVDFQKFSELMRDLGLYWLGWNVAAAAPAGREA
jgi:CheY-like chemotaxis protein